MEPNRRPNIARSTPLATNTTTNSSGSRLLMPLPCSHFLIRLRQRLAVDDGDHLIDAGLDAAVVVARLEMRCDRLIDDAFRDRVGQRALQTVADLDARAPVVFRDQQDGAVVDPLAPELPLLRDANAVLLDVLRLSGRHDQHCDLAAFLCLEVRQLGLDAIHRTAGQSPGEIHDACRERRHGDVRARDQRGEARHHADREPRHQEPAPSSPVRWPESARWPERARRPEQAPRTPRSAAWKSPLRSRR